MQLKKTWKAGMVLATDKAKMEVTEKYEYVNLVMFL